MFSVEYEERDTFGTDRAFTGEKLFKTTAAASLVNDSPTNFRVSYHWDTVRSVVDLRLATITFNRDIINNANCLDYILVGSDISIARWLLHSLPPVAR